MTNDGPMNPGGLLTTAEVAERQGISVRTVARLVERGRLEPALKLGGLRGAMLFDPEDVAAMDDAS